MSNRFVFVACYYNMHESLPRMLHSIAGQSYDNWKILITDDVSSKSSTFHAMNVIHNFLGVIPQDKLVVTYNEEKKWETENVLTMINQCDDDDIICRIDCDDWLIDLDALAIIDMAYEQTKCDVLWTAHRWGFSDKNISGPLAADANPYTVPWCTSHLKTFRKKLLNDVNDINFRNQDGNYVRRCGDQAIYLPALWKAKSRAFLPRQIYHYHINDVPETYMSEDAKFQKAEADFIRARGFVK